jgi:glucose/arabinose dehydrogenase
MAHPGIRASIALVIALSLASCAATTPTPQPTPPTATPTPTPTSEPERGPVQPAGDPRVVGTGLAAPWSVARLDDGTVLISERDSGRIVQLGADGAPLPIGNVAGVVHDLEGGLLGITVLVDGDRRWLYAYLTTASDNRIVRMPLSSALQLGEAELVLGGIGKASIHNGGRIAFGPDGMLYATVGDAASTGLAQQLGSLNGKILRMTPTGGVPDDNPFPDSLVYSMGHRNPQGIAWDSSGQLWAAEFGQTTWDEFNRIEAGGNYGWPLVEGSGGASQGFVDPVVVWGTSEASPSGLTYIDGTFFLAALRGNRVWAIYPDGADGPSAVPWFVRQFGRIRDVVPGPDGTLWFLSNNTDGRGDPIAGDDHLYEVRLVPLEEG